MWISEMLYTKNHRTHFNENHSASLSGLKIQLYRIILANQCVQVALSNNKPQVCIGMLASILLF